MPRIPKYQVNALKEILVWVRRYKQLQMEVDLLLIRNGKAPYLVGNQQLTDKLAVDIRNAENLLVELEGRRKKTLIPSAGSSETVTK